MEIAIHIEPAERPFNWVDRPILVAIELLEMVVSEVRGLRIPHAGRAVVESRIVTLSVLDHAVVHEICPRLHDGFWRDLFADFYLTVALTACRLGLCRCLLGLSLKDFRLLLWNSGRGGCFCGSSRRLLS